MNKRYEQIIHQKHHVSRSHPQMARIDRAAQFAPFAALTGYEAAVEETARLTDEKIELEEDALAILNMRLQILQENESRHPKITVTYFLPDKKKSGGAYVTEAGQLKRIDEAEQMLLLTDSRQIAISDIYSIESDLFPGEMFLSE